MIFKKTKFIKIFLSFCAATLTTSTIAFPIIGCSSTKKDILFDDLFINIDNQYFSEFLPTDIKQKFDDKNKSVKFDNKYFESIGFKIKDNINIEKFNIIDVSIINPDDNNGTLELIIIFKKFNPLIIKINNCLSYDSIFKIYHKINPTWNNSLPSYIASKTYNSVSDLGFFVNNNDINLDDVSYSFENINDTNGTFDIKLTYLEKSRVFSFKTLSSKKLLNLILNRKRTTLNTINIYPSDFAKKHQTIDSIFELSNFSYFYNKDNLKLEQVHCSDIDGTLIYKLSYSDNYSINFNIDGLHSFEQNNKNIINNLNIDIPNEWEQLSPNYLKQVINLDYLINNNLLLFNNEINFDYLKLEVNSNPTDGILFLDFIYKNRFKKSISIQTMDDNSILNELSSKIVPNNSWYNQLPSAIYDTVKSAYDLKYTNIENSISGINLADIKVFVSDVNDVNGSFKLNFVLNDSKVNIIWLDSYSLEKSINNLSFDSTFLSNYIPSKVPTINNSEDSLVSVGFKNDQNLKNIIDGLNVSQDINDETGIVNFKLTNLKSDTLNKVFTSYTTSIYDVFDQFINSINVTKEISNLTTDELEQKYNLSNLNNNDLFNFLGQSNFNFKSINKSDLNLRLVSNDYINGKIIFEISYLNYFKVFEINCLSETGFVTREENYFNKIQFLTPEHIKFNKSNFSPDLTITLDNLKELGFYNLDPNLDLSRLKIKYDNLQNKYILTYFINKENSLRKEFIVQFFDPDHPLDSADKSLNNSIKNASTFKPKEIQLLTSNNSNPSEIKKEINKIFYENFIKDKVSSFTQIIDKVIFEFVISFLFTNLIQYNLNTDQIGILYNLIKVRKNIYLNKNQLMFDVNIDIFNANELKVNNLFVNINDQTILIPQNESITVSINNLKYSDGQENISPDLIDNNLTYKIDKYDIDVISNKNRFKLLGILVTGVCVTIICFVAGSLISNFIHTPHIICNVNEPQWVIYNSNNDLITTPNKLEIDIKNQLENSFYSFQNKIASVFGVLEDLVDSYNSDTNKNNKIISLKILLNPERKKNKFKDNLFIFLNIENDLVAQKLLNSLIKIFDNLDSSLYSVYSSIISQLLSILESYFKDFLDNIDNKNLKFLLSILLNDFIKLFLPNINSNGDNKYDIATGEQLYKKLTTLKSKVNNLVNKLKLKDILKLISILFPKMTNSSELNLLANNLLNKLKNAINNIFNKFVDGIINLLYPILNTASDIVNKKLKEVIIRNFLESLLLDIKNKVINNDPNIILWLESIGVKKEFFIKIINFLLWLIDIYDEDIYTRIFDNLKTIKVEFKIKIFDFITIKLDKFVKHKDAKMDFNNFLKTFTRMYISYDKFNSYSDNKHLNKKYNYETFISDFIRNIRFEPKIKMPHIELNDDNKFHGKFNIDIDFSMIFTNDKFKVNVNNPYAFYLSGSGLTTMLSKKYDNDKWPLITFEDNLYFVNNSVLTVYHNFYFETKKKLKILSQNFQFDISNNDKKQLNWETEYTFDAKLDKYLFNNKPIIKSIKLMPENYIFSILENIKDNSKTNIGSLSIDAVWILFRNFIIFILNNFIDV